MGSQGACIEEPCRAHPQPRPLPNFYWSLLLLLLYAQLLDEFRAAAERLRCQQGLQLRGLDARVHGIKVCGVCLYVSGPGGQVIPLRHQHMIHHY